MSAEPSVAKAAKTTQETTRGPALIRQPNGGWLRAGGTPGNAGGTGRPPDQIRAKMREKLDSGIIEDLLNGYHDGSLDKVKIAEFLAKYGLGTKDEIELDVRANPKVQQLISNLAQATIELFGQSGYQKIAKRIKELESE